MPGANHRQGMKRRKPRLYDKRFGVFDIETAGLGGPFLEGMIYWGPGDYVRYRDLGTMFRDLVAPKYSEHRNPVNFSVYAHNLSGYDGVYLIEHMLTFCEANKTTISTIAQGDRIIGYQVPVQLTEAPQGRPREKEQTKFKYASLVDSLPILKVSLDEASKVYAPEQAKHGHCEVHDFTINDDVHYDPDCATCSAYLLGDCEALYYTMKAKERQEHNVYGINLKLTTGASGVELLKATLPKGKSYFRQSPAKEDFLYGSVYGGFVWPGWDTEPHDNVVKRDCTAAYAARAREGVPAGTGIWTRSYHADKPGFYHVTVRVPDDLTIPIVPNRSVKSDNGSVPRWPGPGSQFRTFIPSNLFDYAETLGYKFLVHEGLVFPTIEYPYNEMMDRLEAMECPADGSPVEPAVKMGTKYKRNDVVGKSATRRIQRRAILGQAPEGEMQPVDAITGDELPYYFVEEPANDAGYIAPHWNAWITSAQRITVHRILLAAGPAARYSDTDCVAIDRAVADELVGQGTIPTSEHKKYGTWPVEDQWDWFQVGGPKNYVGQEVGGKRRSKAKGLRAPKYGTKEWDRYFADQRDTINGVARPTIVFGSVRGARDMMKRPGELPAVERERRFSTLAGSASWWLDDHGRIHPYFVWEVEPCPTDPAM